jgi:hypothetical protein
VKRYKHKDVKTPLKYLVLLNEKKLVTFKTETKLNELLLLSHQKTGLQSAKDMGLANGKLFASFNRSRKRS